MCYYTFNMTYAPPVYLYTLCAVTFSQCNLNKLKNVFK